MNSCVYPYPSRRMVTFAANGMVATSQQLAAQAGLDMLKKGGNAIDAAIAAAACLTVVEPCMNGIGGDAFAIVWSKGRLWGLNSTGFAPMGLSAEQVGESMPDLGFLPITVPGAPAAWAELSRRFGSLSLKQVLHPAVEYARDGFPVSPTISAVWGEAADVTFAARADKPEFAEWFRVFTDKGRAPAPGEVWRLPDHAETLTEIARTEAESFYRGALADEIDRYMRGAGGYLRKSDLSSFSPEWVEPLGINYRGYDVWELPPNGQGMIALMALGILGEMRLPQADDPRGWHLPIEALKLAMTDAHAYIADPKYMKVAPKQMLSPEYAAQRRALIGDRAIMPFVGNPTDAGTVYLCAADSQGNMISFIQSNFKGFGSGIVVPGTGIALHNRGTGFSLDPASPNFLEGKKRPYHTIIPGFLTKDGQPVGPFGVMGGFMQPQGHLQVIINMVDRGLNPQAALDAPRWMWTHDRSVIVEPSVPLYIADALADMGHNVTVERSRMPFGRGQIIRRTENGVLEGATEPRCDGTVAAW
jgi:gamma-glutamyltranspeptidase/glutathione hydrolase